MKTNRDNNIQDLDAILMQAGTPAPRTNFAQNVWRQIRCTEAEPQTTWSLSWMTQASVYATALIIVAGAMYMGQLLGYSRRTIQNEIRISVLQPQTLAGSYLATHTGR